jgi:DNA (cytosine-5)-methyltransferase 1
MEDRPRLLYFYCSAGGGAFGYDQAGFEVIGVDNRPQPHFPFQFIQHDAIELMDSWLAGENNYGFELDDFSAWHGSPPCEDHTICTNMTGIDHGTGWLLGATRERFQAQDKPWVIENVEGAPMRPDYIVCGCQVGLPRLKRKRWFETSWQGFDLMPPCYHREKPIPVIGHGVPSSYRRKHGSVTIAERREAMGISWMNRDELRLAIPPAYTEYIGGQLMEHLQERLQAGR